MEGSSAAAGSDETSEAAAGTWPCSCGRKGPHRGGSGAWSASVACRSAPSSASARRTGHELPHSKAAPEGGATALAAAAVGVRQPCGSLQAHEVPAALQHSVCTTQAPSVPVRACARHQQRPAPTQVHRQRGCGGQQVRVRRVLPLALALQQVARVSSLTGAPCTAGGAYKGAGHGLPVVVGRYGAQRRRKLDQVPQLRVDGHQAGRDAGTAEGALHGGVVGPGCPVGAAPGSRGGAAPTSGFTLRASLMQCRHDLWPQGRVTGPPCLPSVSLRARLREACRRPAARAGQLLTCRCSTGAPPWRPRDLERLLPGLASPAQPGRALAASRAQRQVLQRRPQAEAMERASVQQSAHSAGWAAGLRCRGLVGSEKGFGAPKPWSHLLA